jgi:hypothetical protein
MSRRHPARRRRNPDEDVLFPYAERFSSETFPSLTYPDYSTTLVQRRGSTARLPAPSESLVLDAFFDNDFASLLENPRRTHRSNPLKGSVEGNFLVSRGDDGRVRAAMRLSDVVAVDLYKHPQTKILYTQVKATDGVNIYVEDTPEEVLRLVEGRTRSNPAKKAPAAKKKAPAKRRAAAASRATSKAAHLGKATAEVMHEDGAYEVITAKGKKFAWDDLRRIVGGDLLEFVPLGGGRVMVVNEEGMMRGMDINPGASLLVRTSIFGPAVVLARNAL